MLVSFLVYDNKSYINFFPLNLAYLAAVVRNAGHEVSVYSQDITHAPDEDITRYIDEVKPGMVCVGMCAGYYQYRKLLSMSKAIRNAKHRPLYIIGGHIASPDPEYFLRITGADCICIGEGEDAILKFIENPSLKTVQCPEIRDVNSIPFPAWDLFDMGHYSLIRMPNCDKSDKIMPMLSGRGCSFNCIFCYRLMTGIRVRNKNAIIDEIRALQSRYGITYYTFSDELLMESIPRTIELCQAFIDAKLNIKWDCNGRLNYAKPYVLKIMKDAGCVFINYGIEAFDNTVLRNMNKCLTTDMIERGVQETLKAGISPGLNIIWGNPGDNIDTLNAGMDFLLKYDDHSQFRTIRPCTFYPGCPGWYKAIEMGLVKNVQDFYENKHTNSDLFSINMMDIPTEIAHKELYRVNNILIREYFKKQMQNYRRQSYNLYIKNDASFRGYRSL